MIEPVLRFNRLKSKLVRRFGVFLPTGNWIMNRIHIHQGQRGYWSEDLAQSEGTRLVYYSIQSSMTLSLVRRWSSPLSSQNLTHITNFEISRKEKTEKKILEKRGSSLPVVRRGTDGDRRSWKRSFPPVAEFFFFSLLDHSSRSRPILNSWVVRPHRVEWERSKSCLLPRATRFPNHTRPARSSDINLTETTNGRSTFHFEQ